MNWKRVATGVGVCLVLMFAVVIYGGQKREQMKHEHVTMSPHEGGHRHLEQH